MLQSPEQVALPAILTEVSAFFTQALGAALSNEEALLLEQRTEGWVAGLQLAALALRQHDDRTAFVQNFTGSHRFLVDYVQGEILAWQPPHIQRFLLRTAVVQRLNAGLCAALTDETSSQAILEWLERHNLFVVPLDDERRWYQEVICAVSHSRQGHMDLFWEPWFAPLQIRHEPEGTTVLTGTLPDQSALYGVLMKLDRLGATLLALECRVAHGQAPDTSTEM
jgi:hypothetical protein